MGSPLGGYTWRRDNERGSEEGGEKRLVVKLAGVSKSHREANKS